MSSTTDKNTCHGYASIRMRLRVLRPSDQQSTYGLAPVSARSRDLLSELALGPGRLTAIVPVLQNGERLTILERKAPHESTTHAERVHVPWLP